MLNKILLRSAIGALLLAPAAAVSQSTEIPGDVIEVTGRAVRIRITGDRFPRVGDFLRIRFRDPVPGAGLTFIAGRWRVTAVRTDYVSADPDGQTGAPQTGYVAVITSPSSRTRADVQATMPRESAAPSAAPQREEEQVAANVRPRSRGAPRIARRRTISISAGTRLVSMNTPVFSDFEPDQPMRPGLTATGGIHLLSSLAVTGFIGMVSVNGTAPRGVSNSVTEIYHGLGGTIFFGPQGDVAGDLSAFVQGGKLWYDIHYGYATGDPDERGTGFIVGGGLIFTLRRGVGLYGSANVTSYKYADPTVFGRGTFEVQTGVSVIP